MAWLLDSIRATDRTVLVARDGGVVGIVEFRLNPPREGDGFVRRRVAMIDDVVVREAWRGRGIGRALIEAAHAWEVPVP